jgi:uncharacterized protein (DUF1778 family)
MLTATRGGRTRNLQVRLTAEEHALLSQAAEAAGYERVAEWVRRVLARETLRLLGGTP